MKPRLKLKLTQTQVVRISLAMEQQGDCQDFVKDDMEMARIIEACVITTLRELDPEQLCELDNIT